MRKLNSSVTDGSVSKLDAENLSIRLLSDVVLLLNWPAQEGSNEVLGLVCEELLSIVYLCWLWLGSGAPTLGMKFLGREPNTRLYDVASAICASQGEAAVVRCLLEGVEPTSV